MKLMNKACMFLVLLIAVPVLIILALWDWLNGG